MAFSRSQCEVLKPKPKVDNLKVENLKIHIELEKKSKKFEKLGEGV